MKGDHLLYITTFLVVCSTAAAGSIENVPDILYRLRGSEAYLTSQNVGAIDNRVEEPTWALQRILDEENDDGSMSYNLFPVRGEALALNKKSSMDVSPKVLKDSFDLGIRFSKIYKEELEERNFLGADTYPLTEYDVIHTLRTSDAVSVILEDDPTLHHDIHELMDFVYKKEETCVPCGHHPNADPDHVYWDELRCVFDLQEKRVNRTLLGTVMDVPEISGWDTNDMEVAAELVRNEYPGAHQTSYIQKLRSKGFKLDSSVVPVRSGVEFVNGDILISYLSAWSIGTVAPLSFAMKWHCGRARPEEVLFGIGRGDIDAQYVPPDFYSRLIQTEMDTMNSCTAYPEGAPNHPSWPAMHAAASTLSTWLPIVLELTEAEMYEAQLVDMAVANGRSIAGVHFVSDNLCGLMLGREIVLRELPNELARIAGSNPQDVREKIKRVHFDWPDVYRSPCDVHR